MGHEKSFDNNRRPITPPLFKLFINKIGANLKNGADKQNDLESDFVSSWLDVYVR